MREDARFLIGYQKDLGKLRGTKADSLNGFYEKGNEESLYDVSLEDLCLYKGNSDCTEDVDDTTIEVSPEVNPYELKRAIESVVTIEPEPACRYFDPSKVSDPMPTIKFLSREEHNEAHGIGENLPTLDDQKERFGRFIETLSPEAQGVLRKLREGNCPFCEALAEQGVKPISFKDDVVIGNCVDVIVESSVLIILKTTPTTGVALSGVIGKEYSAWEIEKVVRFRKLQIL